MLHSISHHHRILLMTEGMLGVFTAKTAASLLRYRAHDVVGVVDSQAARREPREFIPWARPGLPIEASIEAALALGPDALYVGVAPVGGALPGAMRAHVLAALLHGLDVVSGLHERLGADAEFASAARRTGARIFDVRQPPPDLPVAAGKARETHCRRVLTVGTDCNVGKMVAALELTAAARRRGLRAEFAATGQTGIMISGLGIAIDAVVSDFAAGAAEALVLAAAESDVCFVEGQGSLSHPGYSGVTLSLLHGTCPDALILVHHLGRSRFAAQPHHPHPQMAALLQATEAIAGLLHPARIVGIAVNAHGCEPAAAQREIDELTQTTGLPVQNALEDGCDELLDACLRP